MASITIAKALRVKNSLIQELNKTKKIIQSCNRKQVENADTTANWEYDIEDQFKIYNDIVIKLTILKVLLDQASLSIREHIYTLSELKSKIKLLESIPTDHGLSSDYRGISSFNKVQWPSSVIDLEIKDLQKSINELQDTISEYNNSTRLEVTFEI